MSTPVPKKGTVIPSSLVKGVDAMTVLNEVIGAVTTLVETHEVESTKREAIRARERALIEEIHARRDLFLTYLDRSFDERKTVFDGLFAALDKALSDDPTQVANVLGAITALAAKSPFKDLVDIDLVKQNLADPDHEWTV